MKLPGTYWMYALIIKIFGSTPMGIHTGLMLTVGLTMFLIFQVIKNMLNTPIALVTAFVYGLMVSSKSTLGFAGHATHFVVLFMMAGLVFWNKWRSSAQLVHILLFGMMTGLAFLMKQHGVFFIIMGGLLIILTLANQQKLFLKEILVDGITYTLGVFIPYFLVLGWVLCFGDFDKFWFWTVEYASKYTSSVVQLKDAPMMFYLSFESMWKEFPLVWISAFAGIGVLWFTDFSKFQKIFITIFFIFSFLTICPGMYFRQHYFITWIPSLGLMASIFYYWLIKKFFGEKAMQVQGLIIFGLAVFVVFFYSINHNKAYWLNTKVNSISKEVYGDNPFVESIEIAKYIKSHSSPEDKIAVLGSEPQIMVYADRLSATGHIYTYGMMENHSYNVKMQEEMIAEIESSKPKFIVFCKIPLSWLERNDSPKNILNWMPQFINANYIMVGQVDVSNQLTNDYFWDDQVLNRQPTTENHIIVFKRKDNI